MKIDPAQSAPRPVTFPDELALETAHVIAAPLPDGMVVVIFGELFDMHLSSDEAMEIADKLIQAAAGIHPHVPTEDS